MSKNQDRDKLLRDARKAQARIRAEASLELQDIMIGRLPTQLLAMPPSRVHRLFRDPVPSPMVPKRPEGLEVHEAVKRVHRETTRSRRAKERLAREKAEAERINNEMADRLVDSITVPWIV